MHHNFADFVSTSKLSESGFYKKMNKVITKKF